MSDDNPMRIIADCLLLELERGRITEPMVNDMMDHFRAHYPKTTKEYCADFTTIRREHLYRMMGYEI